MERAKAESVMTRTPEVIAAEINTIKAQTREVVCRSAIEIGKRLTEAKCKVPHGSWGAWLQDNVDYSERTAQDLMRMFEEYGNTNPQAIADLSYTQALLLTRLDGETRAELLESGTVADMSTRELKDEIERLNRELKERQVTLDQLLSTPPDEPLQDAYRERDHYRKCMEEAEADAARLEGELEAAKSAGESIRAECDKAKAEAGRMRQQAEDAVSRANDAGAEVRRLKDELQAERDKPAKTETVIEQIEVVPPDVEKELEELRRKARQAPSESVVTVRVLYAQLVEKFGEIEKAIGALDEQAPEVCAKYRTAVAKAAKMMAERLGG